MNEEFWSSIEKLVNSSEIVIDRPKGSVHPRFSDFIYKVDYGYLKDTTAMDGAGIDVWVGTDESKCIDAVMCIVDLMKRDSEIKILIGCTEEEKQIVYQTHNETEFMKGLMIRRYKELLIKSDTINCSSHDLLNNLDKLHTTELGVQRIKKNLSLDVDDVVEWCRDKIRSTNAVITRQGKNWYISIDFCEITVNAHSYTIITAHKKK